VFDEFATSMNACKGCGNTAGNRIYVAREMMLGTRVEFEYLECGSCGSLQIRQIPANLARFYPADYYSFQKPGALKRYLKARWSSQAFTRHGFLGATLKRIFGENYPVISVARLNPPKTARILDVGCGGGDLLQDLFSLGFRNLQGIDPFNKEDIELEGGVKIWKKELKSIEGPFDLVMLHHSFEHMDNPRELFHEANRILAPDGILLIRTPVANSFAWRTYNTDWVQLDAPRHLFIPSDKCMQMLAKEHGFALIDTVYDSTEFQFWGSEQYKRDIPLADPRSHHRSLLKILFPSREIRSFRTRASELNASHDGDSGCFYFRKD
jgi:SAM-dependent methyltransferase